MSRLTCAAVFILLSLGSPSAFSADESGFRSELVFPYRADHNHAPGLVECSNGDLIASWYRGSGERSSDDVRVFGARLRKGSHEWSKDFLMADFPGFPDCNTCMMIDSEERLWLFWPLILANSWESALTNFLVSRDYFGDGAPKWDQNGIIPLKPDDFKDEVLRHLDQAEKELPERIAKLPEAQRAARELRWKRGIAEMRKHAGDKLAQRLGWQPRCKPTVLPPSDRHPHGRILLPLYSDTFSLGLMAISDDRGRTWFASKPIFAWGGIQPSVLPRQDGTLVAYLRDNGGSGHIKVSESKDDGMTWGPVTLSELANPGAGIDGVRLANGHFCLVYNDVSRGRNSLAVSISEDEGRTWKQTRHLERHEAGSYHYPCMIQGRGGTIHVIYSYFRPKERGKRESKSMKHATFDEAWVSKGESSGEVGGDR
ncbi:MAG TPA: sialidase family protein [Planctomycetaceae bacterium]|jgi:predicted neuraminidase|nr:sialidase family protein [Planctomycetaceae bacterium]